MTNTRTQQIRTLLIRSTVAGAIAVGIAVGTGSVASAHEQSSTQQLVTCDINATNGSDVTIVTTAPDCTSLNGVIRATRQSATASAQSRPGVSQQAAPQDYFHYRGTNLTELDPARRGVLYSYGYTFGR